MPRRKRFNEGQEQAIDSLLRIARQSSNRDGKFPPFDSIDDLRTGLKKYDLDESYIVEQNSLNVDINYREQLAVCLSVMAIIQEMLTSLSILQFIKTHDFPNSIKSKCTTSILAGLSSDLKAIIELTKIGLDVQARSIARSFGERLDILAAVQIDIRFSNQYFKNADQDDYFKFWSKEIKAGLIERRISKRIERLSPRMKSPIDEEWTSRRKGSTKWLSQATHASYMSGWFALFPDIGSDGDNEVTEEHCGLLGRIGPGSIATIRSVYGRFCEMFFLFSQRKDHLLYKPDETSELYNSCEAQNNFFSLCMAKTYYEPFEDFWKVYASILGYRIVPKEDNP